MKTARETAGATCRLGLGKLHASRGDRTKAEDHRTGATEMFREMDLRVSPGSDS